MTEADDAFERLATRYVDGFCGYSPVGATGLGDHRFDDQVDDVSPEAKKRRADFCRTCLDQVTRTPPDQLSRANQVDAAMLAHRLRAELWHLEVLQEWAWNPTAYTGLAGNTVYSLMARDFAPVEERLRSATCRLEQLPRLLEQVRQILDPSRVPKVHAETAVKQNRGIGAILDNMVEPHLDLLPPSDGARLRRAASEARSAVESHQRWLEERLLPQSHGDHRFGAELYDRKLAFTLHGSLTRQQIRERGRDELRRVRGEMYELAAKIHEQAHCGTTAPARPSPQAQQEVIEAALEMACRQTPDPDHIVETAKEMLAKATAFVADAALVTLPADPCRVIVMPEFRRGVSLAYCDSPGPLEVGQPTFYAIAPPPADWTPQQVRSLLREYNLRSLHNLTVHEAMPGHFLQLTHSHRHPSRLRAMLSSGVFIEGWAVYAERMMLERGWAEGDPLMRLIVLKWYLRAVANALLDQGIHVDGMAEDEAMGLMRTDTFQEEREAAGKWVRARLTSAQLSTYFVGYLEHAALRREIEKAWGQAFDLRRYHDTVLSFGSPPTQYVRALMLDLPIAGLCPGEAGRRRGRDARR